MQKQMNALEREASEFVQGLLTACLKRSGMASVLERLDRDISWMDCGRQAGGAGLEAVEEALAAEYRESPERFSRADFHFESRALSDEIFVVYGEVTVLPEEPEEAEWKKRVTAVCVGAGAKLRLAHLHLSPADTSGNREPASLTENIPGGIHQCRNDGNLTLLRVTDGFLSMTGYSRKDLQVKFQNSFLNMIYPEDRERVMRSLREQLSGGNITELEYRIQRGDGEILWILDKGRLAVLADGTETFCCMLLDITSQRREREELRLSLERYKIIMDQATDIIFEWDIRRDTLNFSPNWRKKFGYDPIRQDISRRIPFSDNIFPEDMSAFVKIMEDTAAGTPYSETEFRIRDVLGNFTWCRIRATAQYDNEGRPIKAVGVIVDINEEKKQWLRLLEQAQRDSLTGLLNKSAARQAVEEVLQRDKNAGGVLLIIDLDDFKKINDRYGHLCGDRVLTDTAAALKRVFRTSDVVARIGGDEFLACMPGASSHEAESKAETILSALENIPVLGQTGRVSCSVGAAVFPEDAAGFLELYRFADLALYHIKSAGKGGFALYTPELTAQGPDDGMVRSAVNAVIDSDNGMINETLGQYCFRMLYHAIEPVAAVNQILEIVGRAYDVSRVYIFESSEDGLYCSNTFEWCNDGVKPEMDCLQNLSYHEDLEDYVDNFNREGVFYCGDVRGLCQKLRAILEPQGIRSMLQCAIMDDGQFRGYVGFDECRENRRWTRAQIDTLTLVANVLSTFLMKLRFKERLSNKSDCH